MTDPNHRTNELVLMDAITLARTIQSRKISCAEVMTAYLDHIEAINSKVNAIVSLQDRAVLLQLAREHDVKLARGESIGPRGGDTGF